MAGRQVRRSIVTVLAAAVVLGLGGMLSAATYHIDWDKGDDGNDGSAANPWKAPWFSSGKESPVAAGDTVIIHAKRDGSAYFNDNKPVITAHTPKTLWKAAPGEPVRLSLTSEWGKSYWEEAKKGGTTVSVGADHVTVHGFHIWGSLYVGTKGDDAIIEDCDLSGGPDFQGFPAVLRTSPCSVLCRWFARARPRFSRGFLEARPAGSRKA